MITVETGELTIIMIKQNQKIEMAKYFCNIDAITLQFRGRRFQR